MIKRNVGRRTDKECHLLDTQAVQLMDEGTMDTMLSQAGRGLVVMKILLGTGITMLQTKAGDQPETIQLLHPLHQVAITTALREAREGVMVEEVVAEAEVWLQGTAATAVIQDDLYPQVTQGTGSTPT